ncbi:MAG: hypothetical protein LBT24_05295 [Tannerella sp.]|jgi:hypothetical protein|nr:hypothetical protein [Tannerella sp.]
MATSGVALRSVLSAQSTTLEENMKNLVIKNERNYRVIAGEEGVFG